MWTSKNNTDDVILDMFHQALQIEEPWKLTHIEYDDQEATWHVYVDFKRGSMLLMSLYKVQKLTWDVGHELTNILTKEGEAKASLLNHISILYVSFGCK